MPKGRPIKNLLGKTFGKLKVKKQAGRDDNGSIIWDCECECGNSVPVVSRSLLTKATKSCGCFRMEFAKTHGMCKTPEYLAWQHMKSRCYNPKATQYSDYGGRGITVCAEWRDDFGAFFAEVGVRPSPEYSLDRKEVNGNYATGNVRWATAEEQANNRRNKRLEQFTNEEIRQEYLRRSLRPE